MKTKRFWSYFLAFAAGISLVLLLGADNIEDPIDGKVRATDDISDVHYPKVKLVFGADDAFTDVVSGAGLPVSGTVTATPAATGGGTEAAAQRVTIANDSTGLVSVDDNGGSLTTDVGSTVPGTGATNLGKARGGSPGASDTGVATVAVRDDSTSTITPLDGQYALLRVNEEGKLWVTLALGDQRAIGDDLHNLADSGLGPVKIGGKATAAEPTAVDEADRVNAWFDLEGYQHVKLGAGTDGIGKLTANSGVDIGDVDVTTLPGVAGDVAHDAADSGNPVKIGSKAIAYGTDLTEVAANDRADHYANTMGIDFGGQHFPNTLRRCAVVTDASGAQTDTSILTVGAGVKIIVFQIVVMTDGDTTPNVDVRVGFGAATLPAPALGGTDDLIIDAYGVKPGSGVSAPTLPIAGAANEDLRLTCEDPTDGNISIMFTYALIDES